jgi:hypothetical protein
VQYAPGYVHDNFASVLRKDVQRTKQAAISSYLVCSRLNPHHRCTSRGARGCIPPKKIFGQNYKKLALKTDAKCQNDKKITKFTTNAHDHNGENLIQSKKGSSNNLGNIKIREARGIRAITFFAP